MAKKWDPLKPPVSPWPNGGPTQQDADRDYRIERQREREAEKETEKYDRQGKNDNG